MGSWLAHVLGLDNASGAPYLAWSGAGGDISEFALVGALLAHLRRFNCHVHGCLRVGRHPVAGTDFVVCRRHHPDGAPTAADVREAAATDPEPFATTLDVKLPGSLIDRTLIDFKKNGGETK